MAYIEVNTDLCKKDGICASICPLGLIRGGKGQFPEVVPFGEDFCIDCGHCVSACPHKALTQRTMSPQDMPKIPETLPWSSEQVELFLRSRRSMRLYKSKPVEKEKLEKLIDIAHYAPSGHNVQPVEWLVFQDPNEVNELAGLVCDWMRFMVENEPKIAGMLHLDMVISMWEKGVDRILRNAPNLIVAHASKENRTAPFACVIALAYLELAAPSLGLGSCWAGFFHAAATMWEPLQKKMNLPKGHVSFGAQMVGYPKAKYYRLPLRKKSRVTWR